MKLILALLAVGCLGLAVLAVWPWPRPAPAVAVTALGAVPTVAPGHPQPDQARASRVAISAYMDKLALQSQGNFDRLGPDDQEWLDSMTTQHKREMLRQVYQTLLAKRRGAAQQATGNARRTVLNGNLTHSQ